VKTARALRYAPIKHDQAKQKDRTPRREIDGNFPGCSLPVTGSPDSDEQESRNQCELVKGVKEKEIERSERSHRAACDEEKAGIESVFALRDLGGEPDGRKGHNRGQQYHHQ